MLKIPEKKKKTGICYAVTNDGIELPVIDITHPAFTLEQPSDAELNEMIKITIHEQEKLSKMPLWIHEGILWIFSKQSLLLRGVRKAAGTYLSGMNTYLLKIGANNLGDGYATKLDRTIASSLPSLSLRLRLQTISRLLAESTSSSLATRPNQPLHIINIAGGPCSDSLNMLILLNREHPQLLAGRDIQIHIFDLENTGTTFAKRAIEALKAPEAPLTGLNITLNHTHYDWSKSDSLRKDLSNLHLKQSVVVISSEGGLFDYGTDSEIMANLNILYELTPLDTVLAGSITPAEGPGHILNQRASQATTIPRKIEEFATLTNKSGWFINETMKLPMSYVISLRKAK